MNERFLHFFEEMKHEMTREAESTDGTNITQREWDELEAPQLQDYEMSSIEEVVEDDSSQSQGLFHFLFLLIVM
jgi:hypothetical protein